LTNDGCALSANRNASTDASALPSVIQRDAEVVET
jgi:hypothetical protein